MPAHNTMLGGAYGQRSPSSGFAQTQITQPVGNAITTGTRVIDGTPLRVVTIAAIGVAGVVALRWAGFKFNVTAGV